MYYLNNYDMKNNKLFFGLMFIIFSLTLISCSKDEEEEVKRNDTSIIPTSFLGRTNEVLGSIYLESRNIEISVWDHGRIDGDIVSIYVNGRIIIDSYMLNGPSDKYTVSTTLENKGYNYILLYAHNEGDISPNTATISIVDGVSTEVFTLDANLVTNGTVDIVVD
jgi:hypothetical protein